MNATQVAIVIGAVVWVVLMTVLTIRGRKGSGRPGPGTIGTVYDMLNQDRRNLPDLESPKRKN